MTVTSSNISVAAEYKVGTRTRALSFALAFALMLIVIGFVAPAFVSRTVIQNLFFILTMLTLAQYWNLLAGFGGLVSIGQQAFVGIGAYALFAGVIIMGLNPLSALLLGGVAALVLAVPFAFFAFRLNGAYFAIGTWVLAEIIRLVIAQWQTLGGGTGISLPRSTTANLPFGDIIGELFGVRAAAARDILTYWLALILAVATIAGIYWLLRTKRGLALAAVRDNPQAARSVGVDAGGIKWFVFLTAAFGTGLTGALMYLQKARISPDAAFSVNDWTAYIIFIVVIGGIGTIEGPIVGVLIYFLLQSLLAEFGTWYLIVLGLLGICVMLFAPRGLWGLFSDRTGIQLFPIRRHLTGGSLDKHAQAGED